MAAALLLAFGNLNAQMISGKVIDIETDLPVPHANVYFNASAQGTTTDLDGHFHLNIRQFEGQSIVVSCVGYGTQLIEDYAPGKFYKMYLKPRTTLLHEVVVGADDMPRQVKLKMFLEEFLGTSSNAKKCYIKNLDDIRLLYFKSTNTLEAYCDKPLIIRNKALGYRITYFLNTFEKSPIRIYYQGNSIFEEDTTLSKKELRNIARKRRAAYFGSRMHFFRALWEGQLNREDFVVRNRVNGNLLSYEALVEAEGGPIKYLLPTHPLHIVYANQATYINFYEESKVLFTQNGFFDPKDFNWEGEMVRQRVGDLLPFEYQP